MYLIFFKFRNIENFLIYLYLSYEIHTNISKLTYL